MKSLIKNFIDWLFNQKEENNDEIMFRTTTPSVTVEEAYIPFYSETLNKVMLSKGVNLKDAEDASVKIRRNFKQTVDAAVLKGSVKSSGSNTSLPKIKASSNLVVISLRDLVMNEQKLHISSTFQDTVVVVNVSGRFSLSRGAGIVLKGIPYSNLLINYTGPFGPSIMSDTRLCGTIVTLNSMSVLRNCVLEGETIGSEPNIVGGKMINKTTENMARLQAEREKELDEKKRNVIVDPIIKKS